VGRGRRRRLLTLAGDGFHGVRTPRPRSRRRPRATATARFIVPLARKAALDLRDAYVHLFDDTVGRELRFHMGVSYGSISLGARFASAMLATVVLGFAF